MELCAPLSRAGVNDLSPRTFNRKRGSGCNSKGADGKSMAAADNTSTRPNADGRGHGATTPTQIPLAGWKEIAQRIGGKIGEDMVMLVAAGVTYYLLLALFPAMTAALSIYGLFADPSTIEGQLSVLGGIIPSGGMEIIRDQLTRFVEQGAPNLGFTLLISVVAALWSASAGVKALFQAMDIAYEQDENRGFLQFNLTALVFTLGAVVAAILFIVIMIVMPAALSIVSLGFGTEWLVRIASYLVVFALAFFGLAALYRWGPARENPKWRWVTPGALLTIIAVFIMSILFGWYVANFGSYNKTYGSIGAVIGFMTWLWISSTLVIIGAELNAEMEHQTLADTTTDPEKPMGSRGAVMADTPPYRSNRRGRTAKSRQVDERRPHKKLSVGTLAFAVPAALVLSWVQRRSTRHSH